MFIPYNASKNNTTLEKLIYFIFFDVEKKKLYYTSDMIYLSIQAFLFENHPLHFNKKLVEEKLEIFRLIL